jgi:hypothetical protein
MKNMTVELYSNSGNKVAEFPNIEKVTVFDKGFIKIEYKEDGKTRIVESNLPFIYYDGVKGREDV